MNLKISLICIVLILYSCDLRDKNLKSVENQYATLFEVMSDGKVTIVKFKEKNKAWNSISITQIPKRIIILSSSHAGFINELGLKENVIAVSNKRYFYDSFYQKSDIEEVGDMESLNIEKILKLKPDIVFLHPNSLPQSPILDILNKAKIQYIITNEYAETDVLAQAEWIKIYGAVFNVSEKSDSIFSVVNKSFNNILAKEKSKNTPKVMTGFPWNHQWYVSSSKSIFAQLITKLGGNYLVEVNVSENMPLGIESILKMGKNADIWINISTLKSIAEIKQKIDFWQNLSPITKGQCYNNNKLERPYGANDYWESGIVRPDLIAMDLYNIIQQRDTNYHYYLKLQ